MTTRLAWIAAALLSLAPLGVCAQSTLTPIADAYVQDGNSAAKNFGTATTLQVETNAKVGSNLDSYLKFDLTAVPAFAQAKLRLLVSLSAKGSVAATVYAVPVTTWAEKTITWNNKPARGAVLNTFTVTSKSAALIDIDLTSFLLSERAQGRNVVSLALHSVANTAVTLKANSREAKTNKPLLAFTADKAPAVSISAPGANTVFAAPATVNVAANVTDTDGTIVKVEFFQGATLIGIATSAPYSLNWNNVAAGIYSLSAKATDNSGVSTASAPVSIVVDALPSVSLTAPPDQSSFRAPAAFNLTANATDSDGSIEHVEFYQNGTLLRSLSTGPYSIPITQSTPGTYVYTAKAFDNRSLSTQSSRVSVIVLADVAPSITLSTNAARVRAPARITLTASANDADGSIVKVDLFQGPTLIGSAAVAPFSFTLNQVTADTLTFYAQATDDAGLATQSNSVTVTVTGPPAVYYIHADQIDTPRVVTDQANRVVWRWDNADPFGASAPDEDPDGDGVRFTLNPRFPGQYFDKETGLHYNYFRDYDPSTGGYIQSDPVGLAGGVNTYAYARGNPVTLFDFLGLDVDRDPQRDAPFNPVWPMWFGTWVHQRFYDEVIGPTAGYEFNRTAAGLFGEYKPDVIDMRRKRIWELKPVSCQSPGPGRASAEDQVRRYIDEAAKNADVWSVGSQHELLPRPKRWSGYFGATRYTIEFFADPLPARSGLVFYRVVDEECGCKP